MSAIASAIIGAGALGAGASIFGSLTQANAAGNAISAQESMFNQAQANQQPFIQAGQSVLPTLQSLLTPGPNQTATLSQLPGFQFAQDWGQRGVSNQGTVTGLGGNTLTAGANFATGIAQQDWGTLVNQLQGLANTGASAAGAVGNQAVQTGQGIASSTIGQGNAIAGGAVGAANSIGGGLTTAALLSKLTGSGNGMYAAATPSLFGGNAAAPFGGGSGAAIY